mmetsp:Transcript_8809/g.20852  ORF Transcript_8809/g.20852 Transcript_8809/m.20852 type:complete len:204 (+) Transcript_8809:983-1594(+)
MPGSSTSREDKSAGVRHPFQWAGSIGRHALFCLLQAPQFDFPFIRHVHRLVNPPAQSIAHGIGLVHNFFEHEVLETTLLDLFQRQLKSHNRVLSILARTPRVFAQAGYDLLQLGHLEAGSPDFHKLTLAQVHDVLSMLDNRGSVTGKHVFSVPNSKNQWRALPCADDQIWLVLEDEGHAISSLTEPESCSDDLCVRCPLHLLL